MEKLSEKEYSDTRVKPYLEKFFNIDTEVRSECGHGIIDLVLECKQSFKLYGIELKLNRKKRGWGMGKELKQCEKYTQMAFKSKFSKYAVNLPVFLLPGISEQFVQIDKELDDLWEIRVKGQRKLYYRGYHDYLHPHHNLNSIISTAFNIGEAKKIDGTFWRRPIMALMFNNKIIWDEKSNTRVKNYDKMIKYLRYERI